MCQNTWKLLKSTWENVIRIQQALSKSPDVAVQGCQIVIKPRNCILDGERGIHSSHLRARQQAVLLLFPLKSTENKWIPPFTYQCTWRTSLTTSTLIQHSVQNLLFFHCDKYSLWMKQKLPDDKIGCLFTLIKRLEIVLGWLYSYKIYTNSDVKYRN